MHFLFRKVSNVSKYIFLYIFFITMYLISKFDTSLYPNYKQVKSLLGIAKKMRSLLLVGWAFAIFWLYIGNLVNFHQHKIWGKQLLPIACTTNRSKEKETASFYKYGKDSYSFTPGHHVDFFVTHDSRLICDSKVSTIIFNDKSNDLPFWQAIKEHTLRGPPQA